MVRGRGVRRRRRTVSLMILLVVGAACGSPSVSAPPARTASEEARSRRELHLVAGHDRPAEPCMDATASATDPVIVARESFFAPACLIVSAGQSLVVRNEGNALHNLTVDGTWFGVDVPPGAEIRVPSLARVVGANPGTYTYSCTYHSASGMVGRVIVR